MKANIWLGDSKMHAKSSDVLEIITAIAVVISLIFVGFEIRNSSEQMELNTQATKISVYQDLIGRIVDINKLSIENSWDFNSIISKPSLTAEEINEVDSFIWILFRHGDMAYFQYENGAISIERLRSSLMPLLARLNIPYIQNRWDKSKQNFVKNYQRFIDDEMVRQKALLEKEKAAE